jgi:phosphoribosylformylglycinamidine synthase
MFKIEVYTKIGFRNPYTRQILSDINSNRGRLINKLHSSFLYAIHGNLNSEEVKMITTELLTDKITEKYYYQHCKDINYDKYITKLSLNITYNCIFIIEVWYKDGVTDTVAETVIKAVKDLGILKKISVKRGYKYYLYSDRQILQKNLDIIVRTCLCNILIQDYIIKQHK